MPQPLRVQLLHVAASSPSTRRMSSASASQPTAAFGDSSSDDRASGRRFTERRDRIRRVHPRTRRVGRADAATTPAPTAKRKGLDPSVRKWPGASSMSSAAVAGSGTCRTRLSGSTTLARPTVRRSQSFLLPRQATATTAYVPPQLGQIVSRGGLIVANAYLVKYSIYSYLFFLRILHGYVSQAYQICIRIRYVSTAYPSFGCRIRAAQISHTQ
jgi:hypothetical protein